MEIPGFQFIDKAGNRWPLKSYFDTLVRTELMTAARASYDDKVTEEGFDVMKLTTSGDCCEKCAKFEGRLFSLTGSTPGIPTKQDLIEAGVFHPNCTHSYSLVPAYIAETKHGVKAMTAEEFSKTPMYGKKLIHGPHSPEDDAKRTNPNFDNTRKTKDYNYNCQRCVAAYEARRRGYDVEALPRLLDSAGEPSKNDMTARNWMNGKRAARAARDLLFAGIPLLYGVQQHFQGGSILCQTTKPESAVLCRATKTESVVF